MRLCCRQAMITESASRKWKIANSIMLLICSCYWESNHRISPSPCHTERTPWRREKLSFSLFSSFCVEPEYNMARLCYSLSQCLPDTIRYHAAFFVKKIKVMFHMQLDPETTIVSQCRAHYAIQYAIQFQPCQIRNCEFCMRCVSRGFSKIFFLWCDNFIWATRDCIYFS